MPRGGTGFMILGDSEGGDVRLRETRGCGMRGGGQAGWERGKFKS